MKYNYTQCLDVVNKHNPDILFLQEVYTVWPFCPSEQKIIKDLQRLGFQTVVCDRKSGLLGAVRSTLANYNPRFVVNTLSETRAFMTMELGNVTFANVHLEVSSETQRMKQISAILEVVPQHNPCLLIGDFNTIDKDDYTTSDWNVLLKTERKYLFEPLVVTELKKQGFVDIFAEGLSNNKQATSIHKRRVDFAFGKDLHVSDMLLDKQHRFSDHLAISIDLLGFTKVRTRH
jgi:exonuclease III